MADTQPAALAPGRHGRSVGEPGVVIRELTDFSLASVLARRGRSAEAAAAAEQAFGVRLPDGPRLATGYGMSFIGTGPGQWLALSPGCDEGVETLLGGALGDSVSVFDQSDSRVMLELRGPRVRDVLAKGVTLDLHPRAFATGQAAVTTVAHLAVHLWQAGDEPLYRLLGVRTYFESLWHWLAAASAEYGAQVLAPARYPASG